MFPLNGKGHWTYLVHAVTDYTNRVSVSRPVTVGDYSGYELKSNLGLSHFAWGRGRLLSDEMAGARMLPPLPILAPSEKKVLWRGWLSYGDKREPAKAETVNDRQKLEVNGISSETVRSTVNIRLKDRTITLVSWFKPGLGLVRQEQLTNGRIDLSLEFLDQS